MTLAARPGLVAAVLAVSAASFVAGVSHADDQCISKQANEALSTCRAGKIKPVHKKTPVTITTVPEATTKKPRVSDVKPPPPSESPERDARKERLKPRARKLLSTEIANMEQLFKATPQSDPDRPVFMRRIAEGYVELESSAFHDKIEAETKAQENRTKDPSTASAAKETAKKATETIKIARRNAIQFYKKLVDEYPSFCQFPNAAPGEQACIDEVLYYLAYEHEQAGDLDSARTAYLELTENWKTSRFVPAAYLAFGELYFQEAQGDPSKWPFAQNFYKEVLKYDPPGNKLWPYAAYKLAFVHWNQNDYGSAIAQFKSVIETAEKYPQLPNAAGLSKSARRDIIPVYALKGDPAKAYDFFRPLSGDRGVDSERTFKLLEDLGQNLLDTGHYEEGIVLYRDLAKRNRGSRVCFYQAQIVNAVMASKGGQKAPIVEELDRQLAVHLDFQKSSHSDKDKLECANTTAALLTETAMAWHFEAVGSGDVRGTADAKTMGYSTTIYRSVIDAFTSDQFRSFKFPRIVKEDWPSIAKVKYAMADLLYFQKKWGECGPAFDEAVVEDPTGPMAGEAAYASVLCFQNLFASTHTDGQHQQVSAHAGDLEPRELTPAEKGMIGAFDRYLCHVQPPANDPDALERYVDVKYARARTYYEAQHWEEAAQGFRDIATSHPKHESAIFAAHLSLDSLNVLGSKVKSPRIECVNELAADVPKYIGSFCSDAKATQDNAPQCEALGRIERDLQAEKAAALVKKADAGAPDKIKLYEQAGKIYYELWKKHGEAACKAKNKAACEKNDKILFNGAKAFQSARLIAKAIQLRTILIDPENGLDRTEAGKLAVYLIGGNYQAMAVYQDAAEWYERFANESSSHEDAPQALSDAVVLRLGLGQSDKAIDDSRKFATLFGAKHRAKAAQIAFAIGAHYAEREEWKNAEKALSAHIAVFDSGAGLDIKLQAHAVLGRALAAQKKTNDADAQYGLVRDAWKDPATAVRSLDALGGNEQQRERRRGKTLTAVGEALYYFAAKKRAEADAIKFPDYKGKDDEAAIRDFVGTKIAEWLVKKDTAIRAAQEEYFKIAKLAPAPPPVWVIRSGSAVGAMWGGFVDDILRAPYPSKWDQPGYVPNTEPPLLWQDLRAQYQAELQKAIDKRGFKQAAKVAYETCLGQSIKFQYFDAGSRACEKWLSKHYGKEYHLMDEFRGQSTRINSPLDEQPQALNYDGQAIVVDRREHEEQGG